MTLRDLQIGQIATIRTVGGEGALRQHFLDMGVIPGIDVKLVKYAPMGDPMQLMVQGYELTLRLADAEKIEVEPTGNEEAEKREHHHNYAYSHKGHEHPGYGEMIPLVGHKGEHDHVVFDKLNFIRLLPVLHEFYCISSGKLETF